MTTATRKTEDIWIPTTCDMCQGCCGILAHRVNEVVVKVEGDPNCPISRGRICAKGHAAIMSLYDPNRLTVPLRRTNPTKGIGVDPGWQRLSWDEALNIVTERLEALRKDNPKKLVIGTFDEPGFSAAPFAQAFGTPNCGWMGYFCGQYLHCTSYLTNGTFMGDFDTDHCNYVILFGTQTGFGAGLYSNITSQKVAEARRRGLHVVVVDPLCNNSGAKADEWLPIRPGTDAALILSLINVLLNELGIYDREFLGRRTNAPYLVKSDGYYLRNDGKPLARDLKPLPQAGTPRIEYGAGSVPPSVPLVWDVPEGRARPYDSPVQEYALEGRFRVANQEVVPAFQLVKEHVRKYTPESAAQITTIPAGTIRRIAREFGNAAAIGSMGVVDGQEYPSRPVAVHIFRGAGAHKHGVAVGFAAQMLNLVVGAFYSLGSHRGMNLIGPFGRWQPGEYEGLITPPVENYRRMGSYYGLKAKRPEGVSQDHLYPFSTNLSPNFLASSLDAARSGLPYQPEALIICRRNLLLGGVKKEITEKALQNFKFIVFCGTHLDETSEFADIALPDTHFLENSRLFPSQWSGSNTAQADYFRWALRQPVVEPAGEARDWTDVLAELAERLGLQSRYYEAYNHCYGLQGKYRLDPPRKYTREEIYELRIKNELGEEKDLDWFKAHGIFNIKRQAGDTFPLERLKSRFPVYFENMKDAGRIVSEVTGKLGLEWDLGGFEPLPDWKPCPAYSHPGDYDLYAINFRVATQTHSFTFQNAWLNEVARLNPYAAKVWINAATARKKGIADGDRVRVESQAGQLVGEAKVTECIHPETLGISSHFGGWAKGRPLAAKRGDNFNCLLPFDAGHRDSVTSGVDACVRVRISKG